MLKTTDLEKLIKQAQNMQNQMQEIQKEISELQFKGESGAGLVSIIIDGKYNCHNIRIHPNLINDKIEILQDLIAAAFNDAVRRINEVYKDKMSSCNLTI
ncbi:MAG: YbaB/EbfC family nucleoid-associated protein [Candidatus Dasytiphilus stammeri]